MKQDVIDAKGFFLIVDVSDVKAVRLIDQNGDQFRAALSF